MTKRIALGANLGSVGIFISRPGDDVTAPTKNLLVDSRFTTLSILQQGRITLDPYHLSPQNDTIWTGQVDVPDLGYRPLFFASFIYVSANGVGIPANSAYYPTSWYSLDGVSLGSTMAGSDLGTSLENLDASGIWMPTNSKIYAKCTWLINNSAQIDMAYTVFRNPMETG